MMRRAFHAWARRIDTDSTLSLNLNAGRSDSSAPRDNVVASAGYSYPRILGTYHGSSTTYFVNLFERFIVGTKASDGTLDIGGFKTLVHETGHVLDYYDGGSPVDGGRHPDCAANDNQVMCAILTIAAPAVPTSADFSYIAHRWTVADTALDDYGLWARVAGGDLEGFGFTLVRSLRIDDARHVGHDNPASDYVRDQIRIHARVEGAPSDDPASGTATWSGIFLGVDTADFSPVTGDAALTASLADLSVLDLALTALVGARIPGVRYTLERSGNAWTDPFSRADARFYAVDADSAGAAAGIVRDGRHHLTGAWGAVR